MGYGIGLAKLMQLAVIIATGLEDALCNTS